MDDRTILFYTAIHILSWLIIYRAVKGKIDPLDPYYFSTGLYMLIFVYGPWVWINRGQTSYQGISVMEYLPVASFVFNICFAVFSMFSIAKTPKWRLKKRLCFKEYSNNSFQEFLEDEITGGFIVRYGLIVFVGSLSLALLYYRMIGRSLIFMLTLGQGADPMAGRSGVGIYFLGQFTRSAISGLLLLFAYAKRNRFLIYIGAYLLGAVCISSGSRNLAICVVLSIVVYHYLQNHKRPKLTTILLGIVILYLFVGFIGIFRRIIKSGGDIQLELITSEAMFGAFMYNIEIFFPFYTLVGYVNRGIMKIHWGLGLLNIPIQFIPHAIWKSKPANLGLSGFEAMYGNSMGGAAYPNIGEFYYEFGIIGAIIGMAVFAIISQKMFSYAKITRNKLSMIEYSIFFGYVMQFICRGHFPSWAIDIVLMFGPLWILKWLLGRRYGIWLNQQQMNSDKLSEDL